MQRCPQVADRTIPLPEKLEVSIVMPCLNEESSVAHCVREALSTLAASGITGEVIVVDNGSTDRSAALAAEAGAHVIKEPKQGYGSAILAGFSGAKGEYWITGDADGSYDFRQIPVIIDLLKCGHGLVVGNRFDGGIHPSAMPWMNRYIGNPLLSGFGRLLFKTSLSDFHCGLRGINATICRNLDIRSTGMEFASEMIVKAALAGVKTAEFPATLRPHKSCRTSHLRPWRDGYQHLWLLISHAQRRSEFR